MGTVEPLDIPSFLISVVCRCEGRSAYFERSLKSFVTFDLSLWAYIEENIYGKCVNFQGLWKRLAVSTLPITHASLTGEWIELEKEYQPATCRLHAARQFVLGGPQPCTSKLHIYSKKFIFSYQKACMILHLYQIWCTSGVTTALLSVLNISTDGTLSNARVLSGTLCIINSVKLNGLS
jgi:hypothetical protein